MTLEIRKPDKPEKSEQTTKKYLKKNPKLKSANHHFAPLAKIFKNFKV